MSRFVPLHIISLRTVDDLSKLYKQLHEVEVDLDSSRGQMLFLRIASTICNNIIPRLLKFALILMWSFQCFAFIYFFFMKSLLSASPG